MILEMRHFLEFVFGTQRWLYLGMLPTPEYSVAANQNSIVNFPSSRDYRQPPMPTKLHLVSRESNISSQLESDADEDKTMQTSHARSLSFW